jgi:glycosyltransferase involved in cell wall biosynthesis
MGFEQSRLRASVIVPVRNGREHLSQLLPALEAQTLGRESFEVLIGDDGSTDGSTRALSTNDGWLRVLNGPPTNSYAARNRAARASQAPVLAFCDADCRPEPDWLEQGLAALEDTDIVAGRIRFDVPSARTVWTLLDMDGSKDHEHEVEVGVAETANLFLRRELFDRVGAFEEEVPEYGDFDFIERCVERGAELQYSADPVVWHPTRDRARPFLRSVWIYNRGYAARESREGRTPEGIKLRSWVPIVQTFRARRRWRRSVGPDRRWLAENDVQPRRRELVASLPIMYLVVPYLRSTAQLVGWFDGRRLRS